MKLILISLMTILLHLPGNELINKSLAGGEKVKLEVIYFHGERRCYTCKAIEANTKKTLDTYFGDELKKGIITYKIVNIDEAQNKEIAREFEVYGSSLFLVKHIKDITENINLTNFAFTYGKDEAKFLAEFKKKIDQQLK